MKRMSSVLEAAFSCSTPKDYDKHAQDMLCITWPGMVTAWRAMRARRVKWVQQPCMLGFTFARGGQLELALLDKLLHSPLASRKAAGDARCTQSARCASGLSSPTRFQVQLWSP